MKHFLLYFFYFQFIIVYPFFVNAQSSNEIIIDNDYSWGYIRSYEDNNGDNIISTMEIKKDSNWHTWARIIKLTPDFDTISKIIEYPDTDLYFNDMIITDLNNYITIGGYGYDDGWYFHCDNLLICGFNEDLELLFKKIYSLPYGFINPKIYIVKGKNGIIYGFGHIYKNVGERDFYIVKFNEDGDTLKTVLGPATPGLEIVMGIMEKQDNIGVIGFGEDFEYSSWVQVIEIDTNLNYIITELNDIANGYSFGIAATAKWLNDSIYLFSSCDDPSNNKFIVEDLFISKMNTSHQFVGEPIWLGREDTTDFPGDYSMDFVNPDNIFLASHTGQGGQAQGQYNYFIGLIDEDLNVKGTKRIGEENINYMFTTLCATSDGGCIFISARNDYLNTPEYDFDLHILKLYPEDIITSASETQLQIDSDYSVFPNPGNNIIYVQTARKGVKVQLFDDKANVVLEKQLENKFTNIVNTSSLSSGIYIYKFTDMKGFTESGKWIKK
ncbi:MAG: T9SS type A sorting domain-containing protein [Bacteroidales bacterium]|nr:T9SS type A sorting domain-containing protein [Bacteroidales bacterium]